MIDKEFDKFFSKKLGEEQGFPFDEREWEKLSDRLEAHNRLKTTDGASNKKWLWLLPILLLLLGGNIWFLSKMNHFQNQNTALIQQISDIKSIIQKRDTVVKTELHYIHDTTIIYKYSAPVNYENNNQLPKYSQNYKQIPPSVENDILNIIPNQNTNSTIARDNESQELQKEIADLKQQIAHLTTIVEKNQVNGADLNKIKIEKDSLNKALAQIIEAVKEKDLSKKETNPIVQNPEKSAKNKRFYVGVNGGLLYYKSKWLNKDNIEVARNEKSWQAGIKTEFAFNERWRLMAGADYCPFDINIPWSDTRYNLAEPPLDKFPTTKFALKKSAALQKFVQGYIGVKHVFIGKNWRPYIGLAHTTMRILPFETQFDFQYLWSTNGYIVNVKTPGKTITNMIMLNGGWEWQFSRHFSLLTEGYYYKDMHKTPKTFDQYGIRSAIMIGF